MSLVGLDFQLLTICQRLLFLYFIDIDGSFEAALERIFKKGIFASCAEPAARLTCICPIALVYAIAL